MAKDLFVEHPDLEIRDCICNYVYPLPFVPVNIKVLPVPFRCPAFKGKRAQPNVPALWVGNLIIVGGKPKIDPIRAICVQCLRNTYILSHIGVRVVNCCFFCWKSAGNSVGIHPDAVIRVPKAPKKPESFEIGRAVLCCPTPSHMRITASNTLANALAAVMNRQCVNTPYTSDHDFQPVFDMVNKFFRKWFPCVNDIIYMTFEEWIVGAGMSPANKAEIREAHEWFDGLGVEAKKEVFSKLNGTSKCFVKKDNDKMGFRARMISGMEPLITSITGPFVASIQRTFEKYLCNRFLFAAGKTLEDLNLWRSRQSPDAKWLNLDFTEFDSTLKAQAQNLQLLMYKLILEQNAPEDPAFILSVLKYQKLHMPARTHHGIKYSILGTTKSGASDTCFGNTMENMFLILFSLSKSANRCPDELYSLGQVAMAIMGDDNSLCIDPSLDSSELESNLKDLGMIPKIIDKGPERHCFLNMLPVPCDSEHGFSYTLLAGRLLSRLMNTLSDPKVPADHISGVVQCLWPSVAHHPVLNAWFSQLWFLTSRKGSSDGKNHHRGVSSDVKKHLNLAFKNLISGSDKKVVYVSNLHTFAKAVEADDRFKVYYVCPTIEKLTANAKERGEDVALILKWAAEFHSLYPKHSSCFPKAQDLAPYSVIFAPPCSGKTFYLKTLLCEKYDTDYDLSQTQQDFLNRLNSTCLIHSGNQLFGRPTFSTNSATVEYLCKYYCLEKAEIDEACSFLSSIELGTVLCACMPLRKIMDKDVDQYLDECGD